MLQDADVFDPRTWSAEEPIFRVYGDVRAEVFAIVDEADYAWAVQWMWTTKKSRGGRQFYVCRQLTRWTGGLRANRTLMLHVEVMLRTGTPKPTPEHSMVDHRDGDPMNCRRGNLRWATPSMNRRNIRGSSGHE